MLTKAELTYLLQLLEDEVAYCNTVFGSADFVTKVSINNEIYSVNIQELYLRLKTSLEEEKI